MIPRLLLPNVNCIIRTAHILIQSIKSHFCRLFPNLTDKVVLLNLLPVILCGV